MEFSVPDMSCGHCTAAIERSIHAADPKAVVKTDLATHRVLVDSALAEAALVAAIGAAGYAAVPAA